MIWEKILIIIRRQHSYQIQIRVLDAFWESATYTQELDLWSKRGVSEKSLKREERVWLKAWQPGDSTKASVAWTRWWKGKSSVRWGWLGRESQNTHKERKRGGASQTENIDCMSQGMEIAAFTGIEYKSCDKGRESCDCTKRHDHITRHFWLC